jgi:ligand-binding SRPBCC domain-containing protein
MGFDITVDTPIDVMYPGLIIAYKVSPLLGIKMNWVTEILNVKEHHYFVDEQRFGPYSLWHHKHFIEPIEGGVRMTDIVHYKLPLGFLGDIAHALFVKKQLSTIFDFRFKKMIELFGEMKKA